jgi:hypothetical protein
VVDGPVTVVVTPGTVDEVAGMVVVVEGADMVLVVETVPAPVAEVDVVVSPARSKALESPLPDGPKVRAAKKTPAAAAARTARASNLRMLGLLIGFVRNVV